MQARLNSDMVIENKGGAGGVIADEQVARAPADGKTLLFATLGSQVISAALRAGQLPYDPVKSFTPIAFIGQVPMLDHRQRRLSGQDLAELIAKAKTDKLSYGSAGAGITMNIVGEMINAEAGVKTAHVPYRGVAPGDQRSDRRAHPVPQRGPAGAGAARQERQGACAGAVRHRALAAVAGPADQRRAWLSAAC